jgi:Flp pilus assembly pilin Flp
MAACGSKELRPIAAGISVAIIAVVSGLGSMLNAKFTSILAQLN